MVRWFESADSDVAADAPLILLPVQLQRQTARSTFSLKAIGDDPMVNPALVEKLRLDFRLTLPSLPDEFHRTWAIHLPKVRDVSGDGE